MHSHDEVLETIKYRCYQIKSFISPVSYNMWKLFLSTYLSEVLPFYTLVLSMLFLNEQFSEHFSNLGVDVLFGAEYAINPLQYVSTTVCQKFFICFHHFFFVSRFFPIWACVKWTWTPSLVARFSSTSVWWCPAFSLLVLPVLHWLWPPTVSCR